MTQSIPESPTHPKLRPLDPKWIEYEGQEYLYLRDPMTMAEQSIIVPKMVAPLLALCDGTRDIYALQVSLALRTGMQLPVSTIKAFVTQLDSALLLQNGAFERASERMLNEYRDAPYRRPSHAGATYPPDADGLSMMFQEYCSKVESEPDRRVSNGVLAGMLCPHIDYERGHKTYAQLWQKAAAYLEDIELVVIFGTDHSGGLGTITPTRQSYATPFGVLPTETDVVDGLVRVLGPEKAFAEELHHVNEHSIELASVWLHYFLGGRPCPVVPVLCGSFHHFVAGDGNPDEDGTVNAAISFLREAIGGRKTLVIAAGDLAHVGPAFGDSLPLDEVARAKLWDDDKDSMNAICNGDAASFFEHSRQESDARRICGLSPIYLTLKLLGNARGESMGYAQCPADEHGGSLVSIAGALLYQA